ncbi:MAG: hypothetical protein ACYSWW_11160 [Planctomycetota bacterium]|jgi:hypothetical protein
MCRKLTYSFHLVLVLGFVLTGTAYAGSPILKLDINQTDTPAETEADFVSFTLADSGSEVAGITVEFGGTLDSRRRDTPAGVPLEQIYRDFIFSRPGSMTVTLSGLAGNTTYEITIYAFDTGSAQTRIAEWTANGEFVCTTEFDGAVDSPEAEGDYAFTGKATADSSGIIVLESAPVEGTREMSGASHPFAFLNGLVISSSAPITKARRPEPANGALYADTWVNLSWMPGDLAVSHDVYLGDDFDGVNNGTPSSPGFVGNQSSTFIVAGFPGFPYPEGLVPGTTYYWRIDEVNDAEPNSPWKGDVWSFSIPPKTAYFPDPADGTDFVDPNATFSWTGGFGAKLHTVYLGTNFNDVNNAVGGAPQGTTTFTPGPLESEKIYYWRVDEFDAFETYKGDVWAFTTPGAVGNPQPANGAVDVQMTSTLSWTPADNAASHELYFGTDVEAVKNATTASPEYIGPRALGAESYEPGGLAWDSSYAWRVDEVYPDGTVKGLVWSFSTADFIVVDDFESYNDIDPPDPNSNRIFDKWIDGFGTTTNGALVGNDLPPYAEQTVVHGGAQSMIYRYDNNLKTSEATLTLVYPRDWTEEGVGNLSLWIRGDFANAAERMYVALNGNAIVYNDDPAVAQTSIWTEWVIPLQAFADQSVDLTNVNTISIGLGDKNNIVAGGSGVIYVDDIRLYRPAQ